MTRQMTGAEMVVQALQDQGVEHIFGYPGGAVLPIYDALFQQEQVKHVLVRHEQGAVHAAEGYARSTGKVGCVLVTSGPGATNAVTGLTDALMDSIPLVCITGQVPTHLIGSDAFQECDTVGITRPCTKHNYLVKRIEDLPRILHEAFYVAPTAGPGPVVVDIPKDIQFAKGAYARPRSNQPQDLPPADQGRPRARSGAAVELIATARSGRCSTRAAASSIPVRRPPTLLRELVRADRLPDHLDADGARRLSGGRPPVARHAGHARHLRGQPRHARLRRDDLHRRALRRPDHRPARRVLARSKKIHIDIDPSSINKNVRADIGIVGDCGHVLEDMVRLWRTQAPQLDKAALADVVEARSRAGGRATASATATSKDVIKPQYAMQRLYELTKDRDVYITTEVGQHQMWAAQYFHFEEPNRWMTSGGLGHHGLRPAGRGRRADGPSGARSSSTSPARPRS